MYLSRNVVRVIKSRRLRWTGHVDRVEEYINTFKLLKGKDSGKRTLGSSCRTLENNIIIVFNKIGVYVRSWIDMT